MASGNNYPEDPEHTYWKKVKQSFVDSRKAREREEDVKNGGKNPKKKEQEEEAKQTPSDPPYKSKRPEELNLEDYADILINAHERIQAYKAAQEKEG